LFAAQRDGGEPGGNPSTGWTVEPDGPGTTKTTTTGRTHQDPAPS